MQCAPTCIGFCRGGECASCGSSGLLWPWWLCLWPRAARCLLHGLGDRRGICLSPLRSCRIASSRFVSHLMKLTILQTQCVQNITHNRTTIILTPLQLLQTFKCYVTTFFCGCGYGNLCWGCMLKYNPYPLTLSFFFHPFARTLSCCTICLRGTLNNMCCQVVRSRCSFLWPAPPSTPPPCLIALVPVALQFYLNLLESLNYLASGRFMNPAD